MSRVLFVPFAIDATLANRSTPVPYPVAARQLPRVLAELVAAAPQASDWQTTFLPIVGNDQGSRSFVSFEDLLPLEQLETILGPQPLPDVLIEGALRADSVQLRALAPLTGRVLVQYDELPYDPADPRILLNRLTLEVWDALDLAGRPPPPPDLPAAAFVFWLGGRDEELALAANLSRAAGPSPFTGYLAALQHAPGNRVLVDAVLEMARLCIRQGRGDPKDAAAALARVARGGQAPARFLRAALELARAAGSGAAFERIALSYLRRDPGDAELALAVGSSLAGRGRSTEARELLRACAEAWGRVPEPQGPHVLALLVELCSLAGEERDAERYTRALRELPGLPAHAAEVLARRLREQGRLEAAAEVLGRALEREPGATGLLLERGRVLMLTGDSDGARAAFERAREGDELTRVEAERHLRLVASPELLRILEAAEGRIAEGKPREALLLAKRATRLAPDLPEAAYVLGLARSALGHRRRAVRALRHALGLLPDFPEARNRLGILLVSLGRYREAYAELTQVLDQRSGQLGPLLHMAQACYYLKRFEEGAGLLARAEELFPDHPAVQKTRETFYPIDA